MQRCITTSVRYAGGNPVTQVQARAVGASQAGQAAAQLVHLRAGGAGAGLGAGDLFGTRASGAGGGYAQPAAHSLVRPRLCAAGGGAGADPSRAADLGAARQIGGVAVAPAVDGGLCADGADPDGHGGDFRGAHGECRARRLVFRPGQRRGRLVFGSSRGLRGRAARGAYLGRADPCPQHRQRPGTGH